MDYQPHLWVRRKTFYSVLHFKQAYVLGGDNLPALEVTLIYFASYLGRTIKHSTIKLYLVAVRNLHISCGHGDPFQENYS